MIRHGISRTLLVGSVLAACGVPSGDRVELLDSSEYVVDVRPTAAPAPAPAPGPRFDGVLIYFVRDAGLRARVTLAPEDFGIDDIIDALAAGPDAADAATGLRSALSDRRSLVIDTAVRDSVANVELAASFGDLPGSEQILFLGQVTLSLVGNSLAESVLYTIDGRALAVPGADGAPISAPTERKDYVELITR